MDKKIGILTMVLCALFGTQSIFADQLVTNGGFETGDFTSWTLTGSATGSSTPSAFYGVDTQDAASGSYGAYLGSVLSPLTLSQTLTVQPTQSYTVSFSLAQSTAISTGFTNLFSASLGGQTFFSETNAPISSFASYTFTVANLPAGSSSAVLQFTSQNDLGYFSLDNVSVSTGGTVTPEPATLLLIAPALGVFGLIRRKSSKSVSL